NTAGGRKRSEWSGGPSDIEGKTTRVGASECGQRTSFNRTRVAGHLDEIQGVVPNTLNGASGERCDIDGQAEGRENGSERVNLFRNRAACRVFMFTLVGFIDWLDPFACLAGRRETTRMQRARQLPNECRGTTEETQV